MTRADTDTLEESKPDEFKAAEPKPDDPNLVHPDPAPDRSQVGVDSPGRALAAARRARKLEIVRVATELRLTPETVDALERDDFDRLPSPVFVSGYIRTYARLLGMDPQPLIERFHVLHPGAEAPPRSALENQERARSGSGWAVPLLLSAVVLIAAGGYLWWTGSQVDQYRSGSFSNGSDQEAAGTGPADAEQPDVEPYDESLAPPRSAVGAGRATDVGASESGTSLLDRTATDGDSIETLGTADSTMSSDNAAGDTASNAGNDIDSTSTLPSSDVALLPYPTFPAGLDIASEDAPATETVAEDAAEADEVVVSFEGPCWVDIRDAAGEVLLFGEMADGDSHVLGGEPPYSLVIGNASAVSMTVGGAPFDVRAIAKGNVARFEFDPAEIVAEPAGAAPAPGPSEN